MIETLERILHLQFSTILWIIGTTWTIMISFVLWASWIVERAKEKS